MSYDFPPDVLAYYALLGVKPLNSIPRTQDITGDSRSAIYRGIASGYYERVKSGDATRITGDSIIRRLESLREQAKGAA